LLGNADAAEDRMRTTAARQAGVLACCAALLGCGGGTSSPQDAAHPDFSGVWSGALTTQDNEFWELEDLTACAAGCTPMARTYLASLIEDRGNGATPVQELLGLATAFMREELAKKSLPEGVAIQENNEAPAAGFRCVPPGLARAAVNPLPLEIRQDGDNLTIAYQESNQSRTIYLDGRVRPANQGPTRLGHSVGRYDGEVLVLQTTGVEPNRYYAFQSGGGHSAEAKFVERYAIVESPRRLTLELTITDPVTLLEPHVIRKTWLATPDVQLVEDRCGETSGRPPEESALEALRQRRR
jgi:hypothetical protein